MLSDHRTDRPHKLPSLLRLIFKHHKFFICLSTGSSTHNYHFCQVSSHAHLDRLTTSKSEDDEDEILRKFATLPLTTVHNDDGLQRAGHCALDAYETQMSAFATSSNLIEQTQNNE